MPNKNPAYSHLQTPEVREKRRKAIRAAFRRKKKLAKQQAAAGRSQSLIPLDVIPGEKPPTLTHVKSGGGGSRVARDDTGDRMELAKALVATIYKLIK